MMSKRQQPPWCVANSANDCNLKLFNSFTRQKETFLPKVAGKIFWYSCGPTVYDASHMGHARSYISIDILRRVLADYFGYDIFFVMNITDVDDKIIRRARQNFLFDKYKNENHSLSEMLDDCKEALKLFKLHLSSESEKLEMQKKMIAQTENVISMLQANNFESESFDTCKDLFSEWLDKLHGSEVTDKSIFSSLSRYWENEYHNDMDSLNIRRPDVLTRVSEYIPEIIQFVEKIVENGLAYETNGSVYFDVSKFNGLDNHFYAKLVPEAFGDTKILEEGEGDLSVSAEKSSEKKSLTDFALWKASKPGEPSWESPWGGGRPGWHIECSVMASALLGDSMDIHTGGFDLKFPHHDNEIAQAEAYYNNNNWVRYFLHTGHLTIEGCKMSKSLKNFITIKEALQKNSSQQLRLAFLLHSWKDTLDYSQDTMDTAVHFEKMFREFFLNLQSELNETNSHGLYCKWTELEIELNNMLMNKQSAVHAALCDNIDTRSALFQLKELVSSVNVYLKQVRGVSRSPDSQLLKNIAAYITRILQIFGIIVVDTQIGFTSKAGDVPSDDKMLNSCLRVIADFRESVRSSAQNLEGKSGIDILNLCDKLRDETLFDLGVKLEDCEGGRTAVKVVGRDILVQEREQKRKQEEMQKAEKDKKKQEMENLKSQREEQKKVLPSEMFKHETDKYSKFDENGVPTHDAIGEELSKSQAKKLQKLYLAQVKKYNDYIKSQGDVS